jgi:TRAP-type C4-dicarboxylate transport system permease small subunit
VSGAAPVAQEVHTPITGEEIAHAFEDEPHVVDLGRYAFEDWLTLALFWLMAGAVFLQFFTRYVLNDSFAWTEEIAIYGLVAVVFLGSAMCVRLSRHIHVDLLYRYLPPRTARVLATLVDVLRIAFFAYGAVLVWRYASIISEERMTTIDLPKSIVFNAVVLGFALMTLRAVQVAVQDFRRGYSALERPGAFDGSEG